MLWGLMAVRDLYAKKKFYKDEKVSFSGRFKQVVLRIKKEPGIINKQIADYLNVRVNNISRELKFLKIFGWVNISINSLDRRVKHYSLSQKGEEIVDECFETGVIVIPFDFDLTKIETTDFRVLNLRGSGQDVNSIPDGLVKVDGVKEEIKDEVYMKLSTSDKIKELASALNYANRKSWDSLPEEKREDIKGKALAETGFQASFKVFQERVVFESRKYAREKFFAGRKSE